jgi:chemotaxis protein MotB
MRKKKGHAKHENHERWLVSYADFITLLFAFFVVMYAVSSINEGKYRVLSDSIALAFRSTVVSTQIIQSGGITGNTPSQPDYSRPRSAQIIAPDLRPMPTAVIIQRTPQQLFFIDRPRPDSRSLSYPYPPVRVASSTGQADDQPPASADPLDQLMKHLENSIPELIDANLVQIRRSQNWVEVEIKNHILFASGSAAINEQALQPLSKIATVLRDIPNRMRVEGFTDNVPINTPVYPSNWELSAARAASVVHVLTQYGVRPERMAAIGYGEYQPVDDNATEQGRLRNRRVVLVILGEPEDHRQVEETHGANAPAIIPSKMQADSNKAVH